MPSSRQLAAIMFTDIVGYTALMGNDEQKAFELLNKNRQIQKPIIEECKGRWIKELGDGVLASFNAISDAIVAAIKIQQTCNASKEFQLRIGIHLGEVVFENEDVFGDGVNIASRIQTLSPPGAIWVSESVHQNIANKKEFEVEFLKAANLKNVKEPVRIYQVKAEGVTSQDTKRSFVSKTLPLPGRMSEYKKIFWIAAVLIIIMTSGYYVYTTFQKNKKEPSASIKGASTDKSIAVLPFINMSNDPEQEYFSDGLSEELLNLLAKIPELKVIGRTSSFAFKGKNDDLRNIAGKLGVAHLLEGSVRKDGNKIRVAAQLIKAADGSHMWSETYDRELEGIFKLQDEIARAVVQQLKLRLIEFPSARVSGTGNMETYNLILQGNYFFDKLDKENVARAVDFYAKALQLDSSDARAWGSLANAISRQAFQNYIDQNTGYEKGRQAALKSIQLDSTYPRGYLELADIKLYHDFDWKGAHQAYQKAFNLEPGNAEIITGLGDSQHPLGRWKEVEQLYKKSILLNPLKPITYMNLGNALTFDGRYEEAIPYFRKVLELNPEFQRAHMYVGRNYLLMGKPELALTEMQQENMEIFKTFGLALTFHALGRKIQADETLKEFTAKYQNNWAYLLVQLHAFRGEKDAAFNWLETAYNKRDSWLFWLKGDPLLKNLEPDSRHKSFLRKMNLPLD